MIIDSIQNGIVIDHISAGKAMELYNILGLDKLDCTVAILKNVTSGKLVEKRGLKLPERIRGVLKCKNPRCITSVEQELPQEFLLTDPAKRVYRCIYCETEAGK